MRTLSRVVILTAALSGIACNAESAGGNRTPIYDEKADARALIDQALIRAKADNKHVLIQWGGNWCGWCHVLHDLFVSNEEIAQVLQFEYEVVMIDSNSNENLAASLGTKWDGVPYLTVLDANGKKLVDHDTGSLEVGDHHDPAKVLAFLNQWKPAPRDANDVYSVAKAEAAKDGKLVFVRFSTPTCGWCKRLDAFLKTDPAARVLAPKFVFAKVDEARMLHARDLRKSLGSTDGGVPWFAFTDATGKPLITSDGPDGNIGFPARPNEIEHFMKMLKLAIPQIQQADLDSIAEYLRQHGA